MSRRAHRGPETDRRTFLKGAGIGLVGALLPASFPGFACSAASEEAAALPESGVPTMEQVVARFRPDALYARPGAKVLHFFPPDRRAKLPEGFRPVKEVESGMRVNRGDYRAVFRQLLSAHPGDVPLARAAALLDPLEPKAVPRVVGLLGKEKRYEEIVPFLDELAKVVDARAGRDRTSAKKLKRRSAEIARVREVVLARAKRKSEGSKGGR